MPRIVVDASELTGSLVVGVEQRVYAALPKGHADGSRVVIDAVHIYYRIEPPPRA